MRISPSARTSKVSGNQPGALDRLIAAYREFFGHHEGPSPELSPQQNAELAKRYRHNLYFGAAALGALWIFGYRSKWSWRELLGAA